MGLSSIYHRAKRYQYLLSKLIQDGSKLIVVYNKKHPIYTSIFEDTAFGKYKFVYIDLSKQLSGLERRLWNKAALIHTDAAMLKLDNYAGKPVVVECEALPSVEILTDKRINAVCYESLAAVAPLGNIPSRLVLLYPAVMPQVPQRNTADGSIRLTAVGYGGMVKGFDVVYRIYEELKKHHDVKLTIAGAFGHNFTHYPEITQEAYNNAGFDKIATSIASDPDVTLQPFKRDVLYSQVYANTDIYIHLSRMETFGYSILEAMSFGLPVVATNVRAIPEMVHHNDNGFLVNDFADDFNSPEWFGKSYTEGLAAVKTLIEQPELRKRMGERSLQIVKDKFTLDKKRAILEEVYAKVLG